MTLLTTCEPDNKLGVAEDDEDGKSCAFGSSELDPVARAPLEFMPALSVSEPDDDDDEDELPAFEPDACVGELLPPSPK